MDFLTTEESDAIRERRPFKSGMLTGYVTTGGTYVLATPAHWMDSGKPRDLLAILPTDIGQGRVLSLYLAVNPDLIAAVEQILAGLRDAEDGGAKS